MSQRSESERLLNELNQYGRFSVEPLTGGTYLFSLHSLVQHREEGDDPVFEGTIIEIDLFIRGMLFAIERSELI